MSQCGRGGGAHMMLWSRQAQGSNVIRECSCVPARLNSVLGCFWGRRKQPCHFVHFILSSRGEDAIFPSSCVACPLCYSSPLLALQQPASPLSGYVDLMQMPPSLATASWDSGLADPCGTTNIHLLTSTSGRHFNISWHLLRGERAGGGFMIFLKVTLTGPSGDQTHSLTFMSQDGVSQQQTTLQLWRIQS